jgi:hypothetical protein
MNNDLYIKREYINPWGAKVVAYYTLTLNIIVELTHSQNGTPGFTKIKSKNGTGNDHAFNVPMEDTVCLIAIFQDIYKIQSGEINNG